MAGPAAASGAAFVRDIYAGSASSDPQTFADLNGVALFAADDGAHGNELWRSDGTMAGTQLVCDIYPGAGSSKVGTVSPLSVGGAAFFTADDGTHGSELWRSDGTAAGTKLVRDINPGPDGSGPSGLASVGGTVFFAADDGAHGFELWRSDGTAAGTELVRNIRPDGGTHISSSPSGLTDVAGTLFFAATDGVHGRELWRSDGTAAGTTLVRDIRPAGGILGGSNPRDLTDLAGKLVFTANDRIHGREPWVSDGTEAGTRLLRDIHPGSPGSKGPYGFATIGGTALFADTDGTLGRELWRTNGTRVGTKLVRDIYPGSESSAPYDLAHVGAKVFFAADDGTHGQELWRSDGTAAGTRLVRNIRPDGGTNISSSPNGLTDVAGTLFFAATDGTHGVELWRSDGTAAGTTLVRNIKPDNGGGTWDRGSSPRSLTNVGGTLFFNANDGTVGRELWKATP